jgi:hypothetical protein
MLIREDFLSFKIETKMTGNARINIPLRSVHVTTAAGKSKCYIFRISIALVIQHAKHMRYIYCLLWHVWLYHFFPHYLTNVKIFEKMTLNIQHVFWFFLQFLLKTFLILRVFQQSTVIKVQPSSCKDSWSVSDLNRTSISWQISKKYANINFHENPSSGSQVIPCGWADGRTDMTKLKAAFWNFVNSPKKQYT